MSHGFSRIRTDQAPFSDINWVAMATLPVGLKHSELTETIIGIFYDAYTTNLDMGSLSRLTRKRWLLALEESGLRAAREVPVPVWFHSRKVGQYYADLIVEDVVLLELKAARTLESAHEAQLLHYMRATEIEVGLLLNFGVRPQFRRLLFDNDRKKIRGNLCESVAKVSA